MRRWLLACGVIVLLAVPSGAAAASRPASRAASRATSAASRATVLRIGAPEALHPIAPGFLGLSLEYWAIPAYAGTDPAAVDPVFVQLIRNLAGGHPPVLRIGGDTTDDTWWPLPGESPPPGVTYTLTPAWLETTRALVAALDARLILGINLEADSATVAAGEADALVNGLGRQSITALELGNEPELYGIFPWGGSGAPGRPGGYDFAAFDQDFARIGAALPGLPLAGPTIGAPDWFGYVKPFLSDQPRLSLVTLHRYPLQLCFVFPGQPNFPTIPHLFTAWSTRSLAASVAAAVRSAHGRHVPLRIDEMNTISCGSVPGVARSFASALWALDTLFQMAAVGVDGVNIHTFPGADYALFTFDDAAGRWRAAVAPEYYGLDLFSRAAPAGSRLLRIAPIRVPRLKAWAVRAPDRSTRIVVINEGRRTRTVAVATPPAALHTKAKLERLQAPGLGATTGVTLGGQSFGAATSTGRLTGRRRTLAVAPSAGEYTFDVPAASAALLTLPPD